MASLLPTTRAALAAAPRTACGKASPSCSYPAPSVRRPRATAWVSLVVAFLLGLVLGTALLDQRPVNGAVSEWSATDRLRDALLLGGDAWRRYGKAAWRLPKDSRQRAERLLQRYPLIDGHLDVPVYTYYFFNNSLDSVPFDAEPLPNGTYPMPGQVDIPRLRKGKSGGYFWSVYVTCPTEDVGEDFERAGSSQAVRNTLQQLDVVGQMVAKYPHDFELTSTAASARRAFHRGKLISFIGIEGGHSLGNSLFALRAYAAAYARHGEIGPVRYLTLTHTCHNAFADSAAPEKPKWNGLSPYGPLLIRELNRLGIVPDLSHVSDATASQTIDLSEGPVMLSHSSARALQDTARNVPDSILSQLVRVRAARGADRDFVVMVNVFPGFLGGSGDLDRVVAHVRHLAAVVGRAHVGVGTDFDGIERVPDGLEDVSAYPALVARLVDEGWSEAQLEGFVGGNVLRVLEAAERTASRLRREGRRPEWRSYEAVLAEARAGALDGRAGRD